MRFLDEYEAALQRSRQRDDDAVAEGEQGLRTDAMLRPASRAGGQAVNPAVVPVNPGYRLASQLALTNQFRNSSHTPREPSLTLAKERMSYGWQATRRLASPMVSQLVAVPGNGRRYTKRWGLDDPDNWRPNRA